MADEVKKYKMSLPASEIDAALLAAKNAVTHTPQTLTEDQKTQARENIGAANAEVLGDVNSALDAILTIQNELIGGDGA